MNAKFVILVWVVCAKMILIMEKVLNVTEDYIKEVIKNIDVETSLIIKNIDVETSYIEVADDVTISEISNYQVITFLCFQTENLSYKRILHESQTWDQAESTLP